MKRKFLEDLGLDKEAIDKIMSENGADIERTKSEYSTIESERDSLKEQLEKANETIESVKDYDQVKSEVSKYKEELENYKKEQETTQVKNSIKTQLEAYAKEKGAKDVDLLHSLVNFDSLMASKNQNEDIKSFVDDLAEKKAFLFGSDEPINNAITTQTTENNGKLKTDGFSFNFIGVRPKKEQ